MTPPYVQQQKLFLLRYLGQLVGCTVDAVSVKVEGRDCWPRITVRRPATRANGMKEEVYNLEVGRDAEGNGPGWLFGLPDPEEQRDG